MSLNPAPHELFDVRKQRSPLSFRQFGQVEDRARPAELNPFELNATRAESHHLAAEVLDLLVPEVKPGVTTAYLDKLAFDYVVAHGGIPACLEAFKIATEVFKEVDDAKK